MEKVNLNVKKSTNRIQLKKNILKIIQITLKIFFKKTENIFYLLFLLGIKRMYHNIM